MTEEDLELRYVFVLEYKAVGQGLDDGLGDLGGVFAWLPSNYDRQYVLDHAIEQVQAIVCKLLVETGNGVGEINQTVRNVFNDFIVDVGGQEGVNIVHDGDDGFFLL